MRARPPERRHSVYLVFAGDCPPQQAAYAKLRAVGSQPREICRLSTANVGISHYNLRKIPSLRPPLRATTAAALVRPPYPGVAASFLRVSPAFENRAMASPPRYARRLTPSLGGSSQTWLGSFGRRAFFGLPIAACRRPSRGNDGRRLTRAFAEPCRKSIGEFSRASAAVDLFSLVHRSSPSCGTRRQHPSNPTGSVAYVRPVIVT